MTDARGALHKAFWLLPFVLVAPLLAVTPYFWEVRTYDDFRRGKLTNLSLTSDDQLILAPRYDLVFNTEQPMIWSTVADSKGNVYLGTGHDGKVYKVDAAGKDQLVADLMELDVLALAVDSKDVLYAATSPDGKVYKITAGAPPQVFFDPDAKYIWSMTFDKQGRLLVATGDKGIIYRVNPDGKGETFYDTDETHVISMAIDKEGNVIAGGDPKGYIYRISPDGKAFVLYDSGMREVHAVSVAPNGTIYAAVLSAPATFPGASPASNGPQRTSGGDDTISITIDAATQSAAQTVDIVEPSGSVIVDATPRSSSSPSNANGSNQSVVLEILPDGTVNTVWRSRDEMVYSLLPRGNKLLFSTGTNGRIYSEENSRNTTLVLESTEEQTTRLIEVGNRVYAASANGGKLFSMADALSTSGTYESTVRDTEAISSLGKVSWKTDQPALVQIFTRTGNTSAPDKTWSDWAAADATGTTSSPKARFIQWKASLKAAADRSPAITSVTIPYLQQNFRPEVTSVDVLPSGVALVKQPNSTGAVAVNDQAAARVNARLGQPIVRIPPRRVNQRGAQSFQWTANDKNQDILRYDLFYRGDSERTWKPLAKGLEDSFYTVDSNTLPDGTYVVKVTASDLPSNPVDSALTGDMETRAFTIDNTPPAVTLKQLAVDGRRVQVAIDAADPTSTLNQAEVSIDTEEWRTVFPKDGITDSKSESFTYLSEPLSPGEHVIAFRIYDQNDNVGMGKLVVRIP